MEFGIAILSSYRTLCKQLGNNLFHFSVFLREQTMEGVPLTELVRWQDVLTVLRPLCDAKVSKADLIAKCVDAGLPTCKPGTKTKRKHGTLIQDLFCYGLKDACLSLPSQLVNMGVAANPRLLQDAQSQTELAAQPLYHPMPKVPPLMLHKSNQTRRGGDSGSKMLAPFPSPMRRASPQTAASSSSSSSPSSTSVVQTSETKKQSPSRSARKKRRSKKWGHTKKKRVTDTGTLICDETKTAYRQERIEEASGVLDALQPYVDKLPWESSFDKKGNIVQLGRKLLTIFCTAKYQAEGWKNGTSAAVGGFLFGGDPNTVRRAWRSFVKSDHAFVKSFQGKHSKYLSLLDDVDLKREILVWAQENSAAQSSERTSPASLQRWLEKRLPTFMAERDVQAAQPGGKQLALVASKRKREVATATGNVTVPPHSHAQV